MRHLVHERLVRYLIAGATLLLAACATTPRAIDAASTSARSVVGMRIAPYQSRFGRVRPVIAIVGDNSGTELSDFMVPYGLLSEANVADVIAVSTGAGPVATFTDLGRSSFRFAAQATLDQFDARYPDGADYVVVPAQNDPPQLLTWLAAQAKKGGVLVSICNGGMIVAETGTMSGRMATAHWSTEAHRLQHHSDVHWVKNARYVSDGDWISSAGVSAAIPTSIALVEAIGGHDRAATFARAVGVNDWSARHNSDAFHPHLGKNLWPLAKVIYTNHWLHAEEPLGVRAVPGMDEASLALTLDAYSSTGRSRAYLFEDSEAPLHTRHGLTVFADRLGALPGASNGRVMPRWSMRPGEALDDALAGIVQRYGRATAFGVALVFEYPDFKL